MIVEKAVQCERIKTRICFTISRCIVLHKFFEVPTRNQPIQYLYKSAVDAQDSIQGIFDNRIYTITGGLINSILFGCFSGTFLLQLK